MSFFERSPWILHYDGSSCNGCDIEVLACLTPLYDVERFGVVNTGNPKHADILLVTGSVNERNIEIVQNLYRQMPDPKVVVAVGACACSGGIFARAYNIQGGIDKVVPVDVYVPGCAARPESIIDGVVQRHRGARSRSGRRPRDGPRRVPRPRRGVPRGRLAAGDDQRHDHRPARQRTMACEQAAPCRRQPAGIRDRGRPDDSSHTWSRGGSRTIRERPETSRASPTFFGAAFLYENEMRELFGINVTGIDVDLQGQLYKTADHGAVLARGHARPASTRRPA